MSSPKQLLSSSPGHHVAQQTPQRILFWVATLLIHLPLPQPRFGFFGSLALCHIIVLDSLSLSSGSQEKKPFFFRFLLKA